MTQGDRVNGAKAVRAGRPCGSGPTVADLISAVHQHPSVKINHRAILNFSFGSGAGIRTLNLAVNSRLLYR
jgi:hypothetical protein